VQEVNAVNQLADDVAFGHDAADAASVVRYDNGPEVVITHELQHLGHRRLRPNGDDVVALGAENLVDPHGQPPSRRLSGPTRHG
jgi:hypothetical protein